MALPILYTGRFLVALLSCLIGGTAYAQAPGPAEPLLVPQRGNMGAILSVAYSSGDRKLAFGGTDGSVVVWDPADPRRKGIHLSVAGVPLLVAFTDSDASLVVVTPNEVSYWDLETRLAHHTSRTPGRVTRAIVLRDDPGTVVLALEDGSLHAVDPHSGESDAVGTLPEAADVLVASPTPGRFLASGGGTACVWDARRRGPCVPLQGAMRDAAWGPKGVQLALVDEAGAALWSGSSSSELRRLVDETPSPHEVVWRPDGDALVTASRTGEVTLWDPDGRRVIAQTSLDMSVRELVVSREHERTPREPRASTVVVVGEANGRAHFSLLRARDLVGLDPVPTGHRTPVARVFPARETSALVSVGVDGTLELRGTDLPSRGLMVLGGGEATQVRFSADGELLTDWRMAASLRQEAVAYRARWSVRTGQPQISPREVDAHRADEVLSEILGTESDNQSPDGAHRIEVGPDGSVHVRSQHDGALLARLYAFPDAGWLVTTPDGRFDTNERGWASRAAWTSASGHEVHPLQTHPERFEKGLLARILGGSRSDAVVPTVASASEPDTAPVIQFDNVIEEDDRGGRVRGRVCEQREASGEPGGRGTEVHDLRVFENDRLVYWRDGDLGPGCHEFTVHAEAAAGVSTVDVAAYAFGHDGVRSSVARTSFDNPRADEPAYPRAFLLNIGVDRYADPSLRPLNWAGQDAKTIARVLSEVPGHEVRTLTLAGGGHRAPTRANVEAALRGLSGASEPPRWAPDFGPSGSDDLVLISFAGHGKGTPEGFQFMMEDSVVDGEGEARPLLDRDLGELIRSLRSRELVMVIDACNASAALQGDGSLVGPSASPALGQIAFEKGAVVLAASQADGVAIESNTLRQGLLTYVLTREAILERRAFPDLGGLDLATWLQYAVDRVPEVARAELGHDSGSSHGVIGCDELGCRDFAAPDSALGRSSRPGTTNAEVQRPRVMDGRPEGTAVISTGNAPEDLAMRDRLLEAHGWTVHPKRALQLVVASPPGPHQSRTTWRLSWPPDGWMLERLHKPDEVHRWDGRNLFRQSVARGTFDPVAAADVIPPDFVSAGTDGPSWALGVRAGIGQVERSLPIAALLDPHAVLRVEEPWSAGGERLSGLRVSFALPRPSGAETYTLWFDPDTLRIRYASVEEPVQRWHVYTERPSPRGFVLYDVDDYGWRAADLEAFRADLEAGRLASRRRYTVEEATVTRIRPGRW